MTHCGDSLEEYFESAFLRMRNGICKVGGLVCSVSIYVRSDRAAGMVSSRPHLSFECFFLLFLFFEL